ncbi:hypothetical protein Lal_00015313 [Lupinus albus]|nr:hypothetical protein Lal_00015313 [Lupinus albus]
MGRGQIILKELGMIWGGNMTFLLMGWDKHHLVGTHKDVEPCKNVSDEVRKNMFAIVSSLHKNLLKKKIITKEEMMLKRRLKKEKEKK